MKNKVWCMSFSSANECSDYAPDTNFTILQLQATAMDTTGCNERMWYRYLSLVGVEAYSRECGDEGTAFSNSGSPGYPLYSGLGIDEDLALEWLSFGQSVGSEKCLNETSTPDHFPEPNSAVASADENIPMDSAANESTTANQSSGSDRSTINISFYIYTIMAAAYHICINI